ncbi:MAG: hypothetical protein JWM47_1089 [Acidimicrobiales bacterium]|nr:hypothetical protein [Acidimicrobiales bacterium]
MSAEMQGFNTKIIEEFRANGGEVGPPFDGATLLLLHTTGAKSGQERVHPLVYQAVGDGWAIFASKAGAPEHPAWYHNLVANPAAIEVGADTVPVTARVLDGDEREQVWEKQKADVPHFADYEAATTRTIPVVMLDRA